MSESAVLDEIPFLCSLFRDTSAVTVAFGWACNADIDALWQPKDIAATELTDWINRSIQEGIYKPGASDIFIEDRGRLKVQLCHEADIHVETQAAAIVDKCASRWLRRGYRILRTDEVPPRQGSWREVHSVQDATSGL